MPSQSCLLVRDSRSTPRKSPAFRPNRPCAPPARRHVGSLPPKMPPDPVPGGPVPSWRSRCRSWFWGTAQRLGLADSVTARALGRLGPSLAQSSRCERFRSMSRTFDSTRNPSPLRGAPDRVRILKDEEAEVFDVMLELSLVKIDRVWSTRRTSLKLLWIGIGTTATPMPADGLSPA